MNDLPLSVDKYEVNSRLVALAFIGLYNLEIIIIVVIVILIASKEKIHKPHKDMHETGFSNKETNVNLGRFEFLIKSRQDSINI